MADAPIQPAPMSRGRVVAYSVGGPILMGVLLFLPAGSAAWDRGWIFLLVFLPRQWFVWLSVNEFFEPGVRIQSERHQRVIDAGPYALIRHPGYVSGVLVFAGTALSLGSLWALVPAMLASFVLVVRTALEDRLLRARLAGYQDYARRVQWRLIPGIW